MSQSASTLCLCHLCHVLLTEYARKHNAYAYVNVYIAAVLSSAEPESFLLR